MAACYTGGEGDFFVGEHSLKYNYIDETLFMNFYKKILNEYKKLDSLQPTTIDFLQKIAHQTINTGKDRIKADINLSINSDLKKYIEKKGEYISFKDDCYKVLFYSLEIINDVSTIPNLSAKTLTDKLSKVKINSDTFRKIHYTIYLILNNYKILKFTDIYLDNSLITKNRTFWFLFNGVTEFLPYLELHLEECKLLLEKSFAQTKQDYFSGNIFNSTVEAAKLKPYFYEKLLKIIISSPNDDNLSFIPFIIKGMINKRGIDYCYVLSKELTMSSKMDVKIQALNSLTEFDYKTINKRYLNETKTLFNENININSRAIIFCLGKLIKYDIFFIKLLQSFNNEKEPVARYELISALSKNENYFKAKWFKDLFISFSDLNPTHSGIIQIIDIMLDKYIENDPDFVLQFFTYWIFEHEKEYNKSDNEYLGKIFENVFRNLYNNHNDKFTQYITECFNMDEIKFPMAISNVISRLMIERDTKITLSIKTLDKFQVVELEYTMFKVLGFVIDYQALNNLMYTFFEIKNFDSVKVALYEVYKMYLFYNYPGYTRDFLESKRSDANSNQTFLISNILSYFDKYYSDLKSIPKLNEFETSNTRNKLYFLLKSHKFRKTFDEGFSKENSFLNLVKKSIIKAGRGSITKYDGEYKLLELKEHSTTWEMPRGVIYDPLGEEFLMFTWRNQKKRKLNEINY
jgi:hypothetical protein